jgi:hypothetical protein
MSLLFNGDDLIEVNPRQLQLGQCLLLMATTQVFLHAAKEEGLPRPDVDRGYLELYERVAWQVGEEEAAMLHAQANLEIQLASL